MARRVAERVRGYGPSQKRAANRGRDWFDQQQGYDATLALSSGALMTSVTWVAADKLRPEADAVAAVFIQRLFTSYLPPIWGWFTLVWMRKSDYI